METKKSTVHRICFCDAAGENSLPDESVALVVTSPPYPMISMWDRQFGEWNPAVGQSLGRGAWAEAFEEMHRSLERVWSNVYRVLIPGGIMCVNIGDATRSIEGEFQLFSNHARVLRFCLSLGFRNLPNILWRKPTNAPTKFMGSGMLPGGAYVTLEHEYILLFRKGNRRKFVTPESRQQRRESAFFWEERNQWFSDVWEIRGTDQNLDGAGGRARSAAFPAEIAFRLVQMFSCIGDVVLDPFLGTGTTLLAAAATCRNSFGFEIDPAMELVIRQRLGEGIVDSMNSYLRARLQAHLQYVESHQDGGFRYLNTPHGFPVKTSQETGLVVRPLESILLARDGCYEASYGEDPLTPE